MVSSRGLAVGSVALVAALTAAGCMGGSADELNRKAVSGKVTLDGAPLAKGMISFDPAEGSSGTVPAGGVIADGYYSIAAATGPTPGRYKVSIRAGGGGGDAAADGPPAMPGMPAEIPKVAGKGRRKKLEIGADSIPARYNSASELTAEVAEGGSTTADFPLISE